MKAQDKDRAFDQEGRYIPGPGMYREYVVTIGTSEFRRYAGIGMTLDEVIGSCNDSYRDGWENNLAESDLTAEEWAAGYEDFAIWEGSKLVAVLRGTAAAVPRFEVTRFDRPDRPA